MTEKLDFEIDIDMTGDAVIKLCMKLKEVCEAVDEMHAPKFQPAEPLTATQKHIGKIEDKITLLKEQFEIFKTVFHSSLENIAYEFNVRDKLNAEKSAEYVSNYIPCKCGGILERDFILPVLSTQPPIYGYRCNKCNQVRYGR